MNVVRGRGSGVEGMADRALLVVRGFVGEGEDGDLDGVAGEKVLDLEGGDRVGHAAVVV